MGYNKQKNLMRKKKNLGISMVLFAVLTVLGGVKSMPMCLQVEI